MWKSRFRSLGAIVLALVFALPFAGAADLDKIKQRGVIEIAVYAKFPPFSEKSGGQPQGIDIEIGQALANKLGLTPKFRVFLADESVEDDFRNQIWKGHYLGGGVADVMMHVPADPEFAERNDQVRILAPYYEEEIVVARGQRLKQALNLDAFLENKIGVEQLTLSSYYLLTAFGGGMRDNAAHFKSVGDAVEALRQGEVVAVLGPRGEIEGALGNVADKYHVGSMPMPGLHRSRWDLGMAVKADHVKLAEVIEQATVELREDGSIARIFERAGLTYQPPSVDEFSTVGIQASAGAERYKGPACR